MTYNPQAFPSDYDGHKFGMTLRDYFAAKAMQALIPVIITEDMLKEFVTAPKDKIKAVFEGISIFADIQADAMLKQRKQYKP